MKYVDLFCGLGGFHQGMQRVFPNAKCIFASDSNFQVSEVYRKTYNIDCHFDITKKETHELLDKIVEKEKGFEVLFAGFPCQSFSKAGSQKGFKDTTKGTLFFEILEILKRHKPRYVLLENVRNLYSHDNGSTWKIIKRNLRKAGYSVKLVMGSPHCLGIPQLRERVFILCIYDPEKKIKNIDIDLPWTGKINLNTTNYKGRELSEYLSVSAAKKYSLSPDKEKLLDIWEELRLNVKKTGGKMISPIWLEYTNDKPIPSSYPEWKKKIVKKNKDFYKENRSVIEKWLKKHDNLKFTVPSNRKFEWNAGNSINSVWEGIIQFRPSGIRVKSNTCFPTFVAINQTPIIGSQKRYITPLEIARVFGFEKLQLDQNNDSQSYQQLGNTVSTDLIAFFVEEFIKKYDGRGAL